MGRTILLVDDYDVIRSGLSHLLKPHKEFSVVAEAGGRDAALEMAALHKPEVAVISAHLPAQDSPELVRKLRALLPGARIIGIAWDADFRRARQMIQAGVQAYIHLRDSVQELVTAIEGTRYDGLYVSSEFNDVIIQDLLRPGGDGTDDLVVLTNREREILQMIAEGQTSQEIAHRLHISVKTVDFHRARLSRKLNIRTVAGLTKYAIRHGLTGLD